MKNSQSPAKKEQTSTPTRSQRPVQRETKEVLAELVDTVKHHLSNIFDQIGVSTRLELALFAVNHSLPLACIA